MFEFILVFLSIFKIVCYFNIFNKCGEKGWKAIIPFLDTYTRFKLFYNKRNFLIYLIFLVALFFSFIFFTALSMEIMQYYDGNPNSIEWMFSIPQKLLESTTMFFIVICVCTLAIFTYETILNYYMTKSFNKNNWFVVGLVFINVVFLAILAFFNDNQYIGNTKIKNIEGQYNV